MVRKQLGIPGTLGLAAVLTLVLLSNERSEAQLKREARLATEGAEVAHEEPAHDELADKMTGFYVGQFGPNKITIRLEKIIGRSVIGYSVVAGNQRAFSGSFTDRQGVMEFVVREPGDHPFDGEFRFELGPQDPPTLVASWTAFDKKLVSKRFTATKRKFRYNPKVGKFPQSSTKALTSKDVANTRKEELRIMRNEMYARHGYSFKLKEMQEHFDAQEWYMPMSTDVSTQLTAIEKKNHELIKRYEDYTAEYYDAFGR